MNLKKENKKYLVFLYWMIQGLIWIFCIDGIGNLSLIGGSYLIATTTLKVLVDNKLLNILINIMYLIYSCIYMLICVCGIMMIDFNIIMLAMLAIGFFNFVFIYIAKKCTLC